MEVLDTNTDFYATVTLRRGREGLSHPRINPKFLTASPQSRRRGRHRPSCAHFVPHRCSAAARAAPVRARATLWDRALHTETPTRHLPNNSGGGTLRINPESGAPKSSSSSSPGNSRGTGAREQPGHGAQGELLAVVTEGHSTADQRSRGHGGRPSRPRGRLSPSGGAARTAHGTARGGRSHRTRRHAGPDSLSPVVRHHGALRADPAPAARGASGPAEGVSAPEEKPLPSTRAPGDVQRPSGSP